MKGNLDCTQCSDLLEDYVLGVLSYVDKGRVDEHLNGCETCRERLALIAGVARAVRDSERSGDGYHISSETLANLAMDPESLAPDVRSEAIRHIGLCAECAEYYRLAQGAVRELRCRRQDYAVQSKGDGVLAILRQRKSWHWALAFGCAAAMATVVYLYVIRTGSGPGIPPEPPAIARVGQTPEESDAHVSQSTRSAEDGWREWPTILTAAEDALAGGDAARALALSDSAWRVATTAYTESTGRYFSGSLRDSVMTVYYFDDYAEAESLLVRIRRVREKALGPYDPHLAMDWHDIAKLYGQQWRHSESVPFYERALEIREKSPDRLDPWLLQSRMHLADHYVHLGRYREAEPLLRHALLIAEEIYRPRIGESEEAAHLLASVRDELAHIYMATGRYVEAERRYKESLEIRLASMADTHPAALGAVYSYLGGLYWTLGGESRAESLYVKAVALQIKEHGTMHAEVATGLSQLAMVKAAKGDYEEAEDLYKRALEIREATVAKDTPGGAHPGVAMSCHNLASLYTEMGRYEEAEPLYLRALDVWDRAFRFEHPRSVSTISDYAYNCMRTGDFERAESLYAKAMVISEEAYGPLNPTVAGVLESMCLLYRKEGRAGDATELAARAVAARKANFRENAIILAETDALKFSHQLNRSVANYISCFMDAGAPGEKAGEAADLILANKGPVSDEIFNRQQLSLAERDPGVHSLAGTLRDVKFQLAQAYTAGLSHDAGDSGARSARMDSLEAVASELEVRLAEASSIYRRRYEPAEASSRSLAGLLPDGSALIEYYRYDYIDPETEQSVPMYAAVVLRDGKRPALFDLGDAEEVDQYIEDYQQHMTYLASRDNPPSTADDAWYGQICESLFDKVWKPLEHALGNAGMVIVAPDGRLNMLAFGGIRSESGRYLIESASFHYLTSGRDLARLGDRETAATGLLAMGDPEYGTPEGEPPEPALPPDGEPVLLASHVTRGVLPTCEEFKTLRAIPLSGTRREIGVVAESWRETSRETAAVYLGGDATEARFKAESAGKRVIHLATHGYLLGGTCGSETRQKFGMQERYFARANPLLLSGLFLAGANSTLVEGSEPDGEDGILTAYEVSALDFRGTEVVVLSACETALGKVEEGEGTYGLRRAFQTAGARTVVSTLWPIPDDVTSDMMGALYAGGDEPVSRALHRVQLDRLAALRAAGESDHPYSWAAFMATGDWR